MGGKDRKFSYEPRGRQQGRGERESLDSVEDIKERSHRDALGTAETEKGHESFQFHPQLTILL